MSNSNWFPDEYLELHFMMESEDSFTVDRTIVEVGTGRNSDDYRADTVKAWHIADGDLERTITENEVTSVMPTLKEKYRDTDEVLDTPYVDDGRKMPAKWEAADPEEDD